MKKIVLLLTVLWCSTSLFAQWAPQTLRTTEWKQTGTLPTGNTSYYTTKVVNANVIWGIGTTRIVRSVDGGTTWTNVTGNAVVGGGGFFGLDALDSSNAWAATGNGIIYRTTNGGATWATQINVTGTFFNGLKMINANLGYAQGDPVGGRWILLKTTNGGTLWDTLPRLPASSATEAGWNNSFFWTDSLHGWFGTNTSRVYRTTNGGQSWTSATTPAANSFGVAFYNRTNGIAIFQTAPFVATTADSGKTWTAATGVTTTPAGVTVVPGSTTAYLNTATDIFISTNSGAAWTNEATFATENGHVNALNAANVWYLGGTATALKRNTYVAAQFHAIQAVTANIVWTGGDNGTYARTTNGGTTWQLSAVPGATTMSFFDVAAFDANTAYLCGTNTSGADGRIYKTTNGGATWTLQLQSTTTGTFFNGIAAWDVNNLVAEGDPVGGEFQVFRTTNGGTNWLPVAADSIPNPLSGEFGGFADGGDIITTQGTDNAWFGTAYGGTPTNPRRVLRTTNRGVSWQVSNTPLNDGIAGLEFKDALNGFAVSSNATNNIARTADGGVTWTLVTGSQPSGPKYAVNYIPNSNQVMVSGTSGTGYSFNNGTTWVSIDAISSVGISFATATAGYATRTGLGLIVKFNGTLSTPSQVSSVKPESYALSQNYPNPFNPSTVINYQIKESGNVKLEVFDMLGRKVSTLVDRALSAGSYQATFNAAQLSSGMYYYRLTSGNFLETKKMLLVK
jgi:photosystem II stability/assembly factor-like uncharacterized protein